MKFKSFIFLSLLFILGARLDNPYSSLTKKQARDYNGVKFEIFYKEFLPYVGYENNRSEPGRFILGVLNINNISDNDITMDLSKFVINSSSGALKPFKIDDWRNQKEDIKAIYMLKKGKKTALKLFYFAKYDVDLKSITLDNFGTIEIIQP